MAYNKRQAIERRYESDNVKPYNAGWYDRETVDNYIDNGANNSSVISNPEFTQRREKQRALASAERRRSRVLDVATGYINNVNSYLRSGNRNDKTREALNKQHSDISNYLKHYGSDIDQTTLDEINAAMDRAKTYLEPTPTKTSNTYKGYGNVNDMLNNRAMLGALQDMALKGYAKNILDNAENKPAPGTPITDINRTMNFIGAKNDYNEKLYDQIWNQPAQSTYDDLRNDQAFKANTQYHSTKRFEDTDNPNYGDIYYHGYSEETPVDYDELERQALSNMFKSKTDEEAKQSKIESNKAYYDVIYNAINGDKTAADALSYMDYDQWGGDQQFNGWQYMNDSEKEMYTYLYNTGGYQKAADYYQQISSALNKRYTMTQNESYEEWAKESPVAASAFSTVISPGKMVALANMLAEYVGTGEIDPNDPNNRFSNIPTAIRNEVTNSIEGEAGKFAYQTGMSIADNLYQMALTGGFGAGGTELAGISEAALLAIMGSGAAADSIIQARNEGISSDRAMIMGAIAGGVEVVTEKIGLDNFFNSAFAGKAAWKELVKQMAAEGAEEGLSDILNWAADDIYDLVTGESESEWKRQIRQYLAEHPRATESEAFGVILANRAKQFGLDVAGGAASGGFLGGGAMTINNAPNVAGDLYSSGRAYLDLSAEEAVNESALRDSIINTGLNFDKNSKAYQNALKLQDRVDNHQDVSTASVARQNSLNRSEQRAMPTKAADYYVDNIIDDNGEVADRETLEALIETGLTEGNSKETIKTAETLQQKLENGDAISKKEVSQLYELNQADYANISEATTEETENPAESLRTPSNLAELLERQNTAEGLKNLKNTLGSEGQRLFDNAINEAMQNNAGVAQAYREVTNVYNAGAGVTNTYTATHLTADTTQALYKAGIADRETYAAQEATNRLVKNISAGVAETPALTQAIADGRVSTKTRNALDSLGKKLGARIEIYNSNAEYNGQYNPNDSTIRLYLDSTLLKSADTDTILRATAGHEITHRLQSLSSKHYEALVQTVADTMGSEFSNAVNKYKAKAPNLSNAQAQDEVIADFVGRKIFTDDAFLDRLVNNIAKSDATVAEKKSALQSLKDFFHKIASWIRGNKVTDVSIDRIREIEDKIDSIIKAGVENLKNAETFDGIREQLQSVGANATEGAIVKDSVKSWDETDISKLKQMLKGAGFGTREINKWIKDVNGVAATVLADRTRLDYDADEFQSALKPNAEYFYTLDLSTLCKKRQLYQGTYNAIMHRLQNAALMPEDTISLRAMMAEMGYEVPCGICYEESRKKNEGKFAKRWLEGYGKKWKGYKNIQHNDPYIPTLNQVTTTDGREWLRKNHPEALESYLNYQKTRGSANPKVSMTHTDYRGDILRMTDNDIENVKHIGGLRIQSFSDFETVHVIDMMQAVMDMSARKLTAQAYTKVPAFADIFGGTGIKINLSLIGKVNENGVLEFDAKEGMNPDEAFRLRNKYSKNVGTILVGANDESILAAWADDRIDMVIPFHRSGWGKAEFEKLGLVGYKDFTKGQTERYMMGKKDMALSTASKALGLTGDQKLEGIYAEDYWDYNKSGKENAEAYLELCAEKHYRPVFYQFLHDNGDGTWSLQPDGSTDGYWKSLIDFKMYDNAGEGAAQQTVRPQFDMEAAQRTMAEFDGNPNTLPVAENVVDRFVKEYNANHKNVKNSVKDTEYIDAVNKGDMDTAQRMVDETAKEHGWQPRHTYHGTLAYGFTVFDKAKAQVGGNSGAGFYFSTSQSDSDDHYADIEGADNWFKTNNLAERILDAGEWDGVEVADRAQAIQIAKEELNKTPGTYDVYLKYDNPYTRSYRHSTNIFNMLYDNFDESVIDRNDYDSDEDYEDDLLNYRYEDMAQQIYEAVYNAYTELEQHYEILNYGATVQDIVDRINDDAWDMERITWNTIAEAIDRAGGVELTNDNWDIGSADGTLELTRQILEEFGFDAIVDKEVDTKFNQLSKDTEQGTEHIIVFSPNQIKSADPVTYDDNGNVIPLSERFNPQNEDIRYSAKDTGYHAGDLGKAESLFNQSGGRSTGHFGTGTYFVGNQAKIEGYNTRNGQPAPVETADFSQYNLFKPNNYNDALALHEFMKRVDDRYGSYEGAKSAQEYEKLKDRLNDAFYEFDEDETNDVKIIDEVIDLADKMIGRYSLVRVVQHHSNDNLWVGADSLYDENENELQPAEYLKRIPHDDAANIIGWIADEAGNWRSPGLDMAENYERWRGTFKNVANILGVSEETLENTIAEASAEARDIQYPASTTADSIATRVMKKLGYEGVDVRHIDQMDNTTYGSVIYDLKGKDLARKQEIGTARFSRKGSPQIDYDTAIQLQQMNKQLKEEVESLRAEFKRRPIDVKDFSSRITRTIRGYQGTVSPQEIINSMLPSAREFMKNPNRANEAKLYGVIQDAAHKIVTTALAKDEFSEAEQVKEFLKNRRIKVSPKVKSDFGDWMRDMHRKYFGNIYFTNDKGTGIEETYSELQGQFGEGMFPSYIQNPTDQLERILEIYESADSYSNPYDGMTADAIESLSMQLVADVMDTAVKHTYADKQYEKREQLRKDMQEKMNDRIARIRAEKNQKFEDLKAHYREVAENAKNRKDERELRHRLLNVSQRLARLKTTNANRALIESLIGDLDTISLGMTGQGFNNLQNLRRWYENAMKDPDFVRDPNIEEKIKRLEQRHINGITRNIGTYATLADAKLAQQNYEGDGTTNIRKTPEGYVVTAHENVMSINDVQELLDVLLNVENEIQTAKHLIDVEDRRDTFAMAQQIIEDIRQSSGVKDATAMFDKLIVQGTLSPERAIHRYTGYVENDPLYLATKNLSSGQRNMLDYQYRANKKFLKFTEDGKFMDEITGKKAKALKYKVKDLSGNEVEVAITPAMRVSLYLHSLNSQNLRHIVVGGLTIPTWNDYVKGKLDTAYATGTVVRLTPSQVRNITSQMTEKERLLAKEVYDYFNGMSQDAINAVSEKLKGYSLARVSDYFPINTDNNFLHKEFGRLQENGTIQGMGFLQERNQNAVNPVRLRDVTDVLKQSIEMTSKYVGLAIPVSNMNKLLNAQAGVWDEETNSWKVETAVRKELSTKWKDKAIDYIEKLIGDLQNPINTQEDLDKVLSKVRSNYAGAVLTLNLSVAMKQAASYPTAAAVVGWKALAKAMTQFGSVDLDLIARYTPLQWYRTQGYSTQELGDIKARGKFTLPKALNWIQAVDLATTRKLWKAAEIYIQDNNKALEVGTDEYYKAVAEIYNQIIEETQPNYTTMQRPEMLRSNSPMIQAISMFKTQPFQNFNITFDAVANYLAKSKADKNLNTEQSHAELKQAQRRLSWAITSQAAQLFTFAAMTLLWNALRGKWKKYKDDEDKVTLESIATGVGKDMATSLFSEIPFGAEAWEFVSSKLFGDTYYGFDSVSVSALNDMVDAISKAGKAVSELVKGDKNLNTTRLALDSAAKSITKVFGIPYENVENLFNIGFMNIAERLAPAFGGDKYSGKFAYLRLTTDPNKAKQEYYQNLIDAYESGNKESYESLYSDMVGIYGEEKVNEKMGEYFKDNLELSIGKTKVAAALNSGIEIDDIVKYDEALKKFDQPNANGNLGTYTQEEVYNALMSMALSVEENRILWQNTISGDKTWDTYLKEIGADVQKNVNKANTLEGLAKQYNDLVNGNVDYSKRPQVTPSEMHKAGWAEFDGDVATTYSSTYTVGEGDNTMTFSITPILANGKVLSPAELDRYANSLDDSSMDALLKSDKDNLVINIQKGYDEAYWNNLEEQLQTIKDKHTELLNAGKQQDKTIKATAESRKKSPVEPKEEPKQETPKNEGYVSVGSSWISGLEYDNATGTLYVTTNSGRTYTHSCSYDTYQAFKNSDSPGSFYNSHFK